MACRRRRRCCAKASGDPAPPSAAYRHWLAAVMAEHSRANRSTRAAARASCRPSRSGIAPWQRTRRGRAIQAGQPDRRRHGYRAYHPRLRRSASTARPRDRLDRPQRSPGMPIPTARTLSAARPTSSSPFANPIGSLGDDRPLPRPLSGLLLLAWLAIAPPAGREQPEAPVAMALAISLDPQSRQLAGTARLTIQESGNWARARSGTRDDRGEH